MNILVAKNGSQLGPFSESELRAKLASGEFAPADFGWKDGMTNWLPLSQILPDAASSPQPATSPGQGALSPQPQPTTPASSASPFYNPARPPAGNAASGSKQQYLAAMRANTAYPTYRGIIGTIAFLGYILAGLAALGALASGVAAVSSNGIFAGLITLLIGLVGAALTFLLARFWKEAATIIADIGDSVTDANSRGQ